MCYVGAVGSGFYCVTSVVFENSCKVVKKEKLFLVFKITRICMNGPDRVLLCLEVQAGLIDIFIS
jgi:hypothetical protein